MQLVFYCFFKEKKESSLPRRIPIPLPYQRGTSLPEDYTLWQPLVDWVVQIADERGIKIISALTEKIQKGTIIVLLADTRSLTIPETLNNLVATNAKEAETRLRYVLVDRQNTAMEKPQSEMEHIQRMCPILTIGLEDIKDLFAEKMSSSNLYEGRPYLYALHFDARIKFWDASIWHRYLPVNEHFSAGLTALLENMQDWYADGLYTSYVALENLEMQTRAMLNSYICELDNNGHGRVVTPFKFHAETAMQRDADALLERLQMFMTGEYKVSWRLLMVDDYATIALRSSRPKNDPANSSISKRNLILNILHQGIAGFKPLEGEVNGVLDPHILDIEDLGKNKFDIRKRAREKLQVEMYDVILLDYLLGESNESRTEREYGYDFLQDLQINEFDTDNGGAKKTYKKGPLGRFWVFPISSFPFAFSDKLRQLGMEGQTDHWLLSSGGDPVTTPELFRYNFYNFISQQISAFFPTPQDICTLLKRYSDIQSGKLWRELVLNTIDQLYLQQMVLENDEDLGSIFAKTMLSYLRNNEERKKMLSGIKSFVTSIADMPYFKLESTLEGISNQESHEEIRHLLREKSKLFFQSEYDFTTKMDHLLATRKFEYDGKRLKWLPENLKRLYEKDIEELRLSNNELTHLPNGLTDLIGLIKLDLSFNKIQNLPKNIDKLKQLEYLDLTGNRDLPTYLQGKHEGKEAIKLLFTKSGFWNIERVKQVAISYAQEDKAGMKELKKILRHFERKGLISCWNDESIPYGVEMVPYIKEQLMQADFILLLMSHDFLSSDHTYQIEMDIAIRRANNHECVVIPIIYRACGWEDSRVGKRKVIPDDGIPISSGKGHSTDKAWENVRQELDRVFNPSTSSYYLKM